MARKILLADDSVTAQNMGRKILADAGYEVITVNNGSAALKKIAEIRPDLIVLDVYMPGYSGLEVCQRLKEAQETSRIPVLLTVGKLEPFKPEEAKRVRADSYIVKPFEASELLSALAKLEDKIVPRAEASKPGRFARNIAAIEEGRYDSTVANPDDDSGWKNRIAFPSGKKDKAAETEDVNDSAIYNPVNKDLRTVVEIPSAHAPAPPEGHVDLGALAAQGLPTEVTPEEIAALAAAAAQVKKSLASKNGDESVPHTPEGVASAPVPAPQDTPAEPKIETQQQQNVETSHSTAGIVDLATMSETSAAPEVPSGIAAEIPQAIASQDAPGRDAPGNAPYNDSPAHYAEPVTMAAAAGAGSSRWSAVAVALAPEEIGISLEAEMQKAYAAFAAAEMAHSEPAAVLSEAPAAEPEPQITSAAIPEPSPITEPASLNELTHTVGEIAAAANDAMTAAATEFEATASSHIEQAAVLSSEAIAYPASEVPAAVEEAASQPPVPEVVNPGDSARLEPTGEVEVIENAAFATAQELVASIPEAAQSEPEYAPTIAANQHAIEATVMEAAAMSDSQAEPAPGGRVEMAKKESEIAEHTAAAWASWRRIRETGDTHSSLSDHSSSRDEQESGNPQDAAAMAVAAGAERAPEDVSSTSESESAEIASIVDSVLADLRPKIVEEISRKLAKKK